jgi:hypothetical protein
MRPGPRASRAVVAPLPLSERWCSSRRHPVSGLFGSRAAASLPRFIATCRAGPGLTVGSALDGGPDWADGAITRAGRLVAREVDGGVVVALMRGPAPGAGPVPGAGSRTSRSCSRAGGGSRRGRSPTGRAASRGPRAGPSAAASRPRPVPRPRSRRGSWRAWSSGGGCGSRGCRRPGAAAARSSGWSRRGGASTRTPTSTPTLESGSATPGCRGRRTRTRNAAISLAPFRDTVTARIRARPFTRSRSSRRVFSCTRTPLTPSANASLLICGHHAWPVSASAHSAPLARFHRIRIEASDGFCVSSPVSRYRDRSSFRVRTAQLRAYRRPPN